MDIIYDLNGDEQRIQCSDNYYYWRHLYIQTREKNWGEANQFQLCKNNCISFFAIIF